MRSSHRIGRQLVVGLPIGLGKPVQLVNELYRRARRRLLPRPHVPHRADAGAAARGQRSRAPLSRAVSSNACSATARNRTTSTRCARDTLPANVRVIEFFFSPALGAELAAQPAEPSGDQLHAGDARPSRSRRERDPAAGGDARRRRAAAVQPRRESRTSPSNCCRGCASAPPRRAARGGRRGASAAALHARRCARPAAGPSTCCSTIRATTTTLFCPPNPPLAVTDHAIGLLCSGLLRDGGTLQIGIGELGDAICYATLLRHQRNDWRAARDRALALPRTRGAARRGRRRRARSRGAVRVQRDVRRPAAGPVSRRRAAAADRTTACRWSGCSPAAASASASMATCSSELLRRRARPATRRGGIPDAAGATACSAPRRAARGRFDLTPGRRARSSRTFPTPRCAPQLARSALGQRLQGGVVLQAAFLLGPQGFYAALRDLPEDERALFGCAPSAA